MGGAPLFSIERGKGNEEEAKYILGNSFNLLVVIGVVFSVVMFLVKGRCYTCLVQAKIFTDMRILISQSTYAEHFL